MDLLRSLSGLPTLCGDVREVLLSELARLLASVDQKHLARARRQEGGRVGYRDEPFNSERSVRNAAREPVRGRAARVPEGGGYAAREVADRGPARQRAVFAMLATRRERDVSLAELVDGVWGTKCSPKRAR